MRKKIVSFSIVLVLLTTLCGNIAFAIEPRASKTLSSYLVSMAAGSKEGELRISYSVRATKNADSVGVSSIELYSSSGRYITTILGSEKNGLIKSDTYTCGGTYSQTAVPGNSYYAAVTVFAQIGDDYDSRVITTEIVTAPN